MTVLFDEKQVKSHILFTKNKLVKELCEPLTKLGVKGFIFMRFFKDGTFIDLATHLDWAELFFKNFFGEKYDPLNIRDHMYLTENISLWALNPNNVIWKDGAEFYNFGNGFSISSYEKNYSDVCCFYSGINDDHMNQFYINNLHLFKCFIRYFLDAVTPYIENAENKIYTPEIYSTSKSLPKDIMAADEVEDYFRNVVDKNNYLKSGFSNLTSRECECIKLFSQGYTTQKVAEILCLSPRTVESHVNNARNKLNCSNLVSLVATYIKFKSI